MTIADVLNLVGQIPLENVFWFVGGLLLVGLAMGFVSEALRVKAETPNATTSETMAKTARGEDVHKAKNVEDLFKKLSV